MIGGLLRTVDNILGRGEAAVTVPPLDGVLRPNRALDDASRRLALPGIDCIAVVADRLVASAGKAVYALRGGSGWSRERGYETEITCIAAIGDDSRAVVLATGDILVEGGRFDGRTYRASTDVHCITAAIVSGTDLFVANGSAANSPGDWQLDLLQRNSSGSIWRIDLESGRSTQLAGGLGYPAGLALDGDMLVYSEAWKHRLVEISPADPGKAKILYADLPGYPGRLRTSEQGYWLAVFAPRSQLVELVLREPAYRNRMIAEVPRPFWIAPKFRSGRSFHEPLQGGGVKHLGILKPWAPTMSAGLCIGLDRSFQPRLSLHSRADGATHGVTDAAEHDGQLFVAARGDDVVVALALDDLRVDK
jgi:hypothetical protein